MKFTKVNEVPSRKHHKNVRGFLEEFISRNIEVARVDLHEDDYKNPAVAQRCLQLAAKRACLPIRVSYRGDKVYFIRTDMK